MTLNEGATPVIYFDRQFEIDAVKILPGEYYATARDMLIVTVLGSCVSACIRDVRMGVGGMNHFMLPSSRLENNDPLSVAARYGTYAMELLITSLIKQGASMKNLEAKVFGGARVLQEFSSSNVGAQNAHFVHQYLAAERIPVVAEDLLDVYPRKVYYFPKTGDVFIKKLKTMHNDTIVRREREYSHRLQTDKVSGDIDLF
ncbi:putative chemoreceptor glutamine deamidase CheD 1 [Chitinimonas prasina]|uniref:Probable chemoreceptor glutamine deamidase CheD n=1 Tax=Chitinimonas prasina TaxID=1434937 RepID=A0ABQ5YK30_9NEIS|nr:chemoreceptor glutamine deamidase CheD [Chitinimonas prasina]GLR14966.1 putative chemoreceptor glutamine deamidase CheD 1 [Chitinimonas prasina]